MARRRHSEQTIWFPWERGGGFWRGRGISRAKPLAAAAAMIVLLLLLGARESRIVGVRSTRMTLSLVYAAVAAYRADHEGRCPASLTELKPQGYLNVEPVDAWGKPLRLTCPGR